MGLGAMVRRRLGRFEIPAISIYRGAFISVDDFALTLADAITAPALVGEIGSGDGSIINALHRRWPTTQFVGVDPAPTVGRLYDGNPEHAQFLVATSAELLTGYTEGFDVTVLVDVLHHVHDDSRLSVLQDAAKLTRPGGFVALKEWEYIGGPANLLAYTADRFVSGDATVRFMRRPELETLIEDAMPGWELVMLSRIRPRRNNALWVLRKPFPHGEGS